MSIEITIPAWEDTSIEEASLANLFVSPGAEVRQGQVLGEIMVEKATLEIVAPGEGVIQDVKMERGDVVKPGMVVATLATAEEVARAHAAAAPPVAGAVSAPAQSVAQGAGAFVPASPAARRLARELGVELGQVTPADGQRVTEDDVRRAAMGAGANGVAAPAAPRASEAADAADAAEGEPLTGRRKVIAERMLRSLQTSAQLTLTTDARADTLVEARDRIRQQFEVTYTDLIAWVAIQALKRIPAMNATLEGERLHVSPAIHLGLAVATPSGLIVPVARNAGDLSLSELSAQARALTERARNNTSAPGELSGSTFSLTTLGLYEIDAFTPILNPPEIGILGIGRIRETIIPVDGQPALGHMLALSLTFDHRALDGAPAAEFLQTVKRLVEARDTFSGAE
ncbi:MAG TPA: dihydrolipoamide acetyltransferase family protein [Ktedonobacterales bacterium]